MELPNSKCLHELKNNVLHKRDLEIKPDLIYNLQENQQFNYQDKYVITVIFV